MKIYSVIIVGFDEPEKDYQIFLTEALKFSNYLSGKFGTESVSIIETKDAVKKFKPPNKKEKITNYLREKLKKIVHKCNTEKIKLLLISYIGQGEPDGWDIGEFKNTSIFTYRELIKILENLNGKLFIINECCHSGILHIYINQCSEILKNKTSLIMSTTMDEIVNYEYAITHYIVLSWKRGKIYKAIKPRKDIWGNKRYFPMPSRKGKIFDKYFISKQNKKPRD